ncbi:aspartate/glutamate racemase family protein, partial [bacterium]|nr:aspartate/glutamate racemase family protein [bacterium]
HKLENIGVTVAGIPCNTAHSPAIFNIVQDELKQTKSSLNLLNMIEETTSFIATNYPQLKRIGVLSTTGTYKSGIYFDALRVKGYDVIVPTREIQETYINPGIYDSEYGIKAFSNPVKAQAIENMHKGISYLKLQGAQAVILGCTEIPLAISQKKVNDMVAIDPTNVLARALIKSFSPEKLKEKGL